VGTNFDIKNMTSGKETAFFAAFPHSALYAAWRNPPGQLVREKEAAPPFAWSERHLQCVWFDPAWRPPVLHSTDGEPVLVEDPGRWNLEAGPDFLDAALIVGNDRRRIQGDVEIHVRPSDWQAHRHGTDPRYARVVAHVCYFDSSPAKPPLPRHVIRISLRQDLQANRRFSFENIDLTAYPYATLSPNPPCRIVLARCTPAEHVAMLEAAGHERLRQKAAHLSAEIEARGIDQVFYEEVMGALGYKQNKLPFRELATQLPLEILSEEAGGTPWKAYALLLGVAGRLPAKPAATWDDATRQFVRKLWDFWWKHQATLENRILPAGTWKRGSQRPANNPLRRLAAAAALFGAKTDLAAGLLALDTTQADIWFRAAAALFARTDGMEYWDNRLSLSGNPQSKSTALLGTDRIAAILSNVVVPFAAALGKTVTTLLPALPPEQDNVLIRQSAHRLFGRDQNPTLYQTGLRQQGLIQVFCDFCLAQKTGCMNCELTAALTREFAPTSQP
jgi:hypothetical protein